MITPTRAALYAAPLAASLVAWSPHAAAQDLTPNTPCANFIRMTKQDPNAPQFAAENTELLEIVMRYVPAGANGHALDTALRSIIASATRWCEKNPASPLGQAVDTTAQQAHLTPRPGYPKPGTPVLLITRSPPPATAAPDPATLKAVEIFLRTCLAINGAAPLRAWAAVQNLPEIPAQYVPRLSFGQPARAYNVSSPGFPLALISLDEGGCELVAQSGVAARYEAALEHAVPTTGVTLQARKDTLDPVVGTLQRLYDIESHTWGQQVSVTAKPYVPAQPGDPMIVLLATPRRSGI